MELKLYVRDAESYRRSNGSNRSIPPTSLRQGSGLSSPASAKGRISLGLTRESRIVVVLNLNCGLAMIPCKEIMRIDIHSHTAPAQYVEAIRRDSKSMCCWARIIPRR